MCAAVSTLYTHCSCGTKEAGELLGVEQTSRDLHGPQVDLGFCNPANF